MPIQKQQKKRYWAAAIYPESMPDDWKEILTETGLPVAVSPLHDKDVDPDGQPKKAHYHVILCYSGPTTFSSVKQITDKLNATNPIPLENVKGYYRYLTHKDNPEKYQYDAAAITHLNGFNPLDYSDLSRSERLQLVRTVQQFCIDHEVYEYCDLLDELMASDLIDAYDFASSNTILFNSYVSSRRHKRKEEVAENERKAADARLSARADAVRRV